MDITKNKTFSDNSQFCRTKDLEQFTYKSLAGQSWVQREHWTFQGQPGFRQQL